MPPRKNIFMAQALLWLWTTSSYSCSALVSRGLKQPQETARQHVRDSTSTGVAVARRRQLHRDSSNRSYQSMVMNPSLPQPDHDILQQIQKSAAHLGNLHNNNNNNNDSNKRHKYKRKAAIPESELKARQLRQQRQEQYEQLVGEDCRPVSIWSFESLFPAPIVDASQVDFDLYEVQRRDSETTSNKQQQQGKSKTTMGLGPTAAAAAAAAVSGDRLMQKPQPMRSSSIAAASIPTTPKSRLNSGGLLRIWPLEPKLQPVLRKGSKNSVVAYQNGTISNPCVNHDMTRMVEDRLYGYKRTKTGDQYYDTSLMGDGAVQFRDGVRLGNALAINADRLNYLAKKQLQRGRVEEAAELYQRAVQIDPRDGRAYLGLSRCAQRRRDFKLAREWLQTGLTQAASSHVSSEEITTPDRGANPFLLQALGQLEERCGYLSEAEALYVAATKSRPTHAAAWVALAQLRTHKLGQSTVAGRRCYEAAERELKTACLPPSAYVYTAWAALEYRSARQTTRARELFHQALQVDPKCSAAWLQLGVLEAECQQWDAATKCFETVLQFDQRNSRVLQAYALMEAKRPAGDSRKAIDLFERALGVNPRDAGVLQAYALYVAQLGDIQAARDMLRQGTVVDKRHAPVWQAWGVLETRHGNNPQEARSVFQQGIWACAQSSGNQSGGHACARLWQAWGVLEAREGNHPAARRCFSRALDASSGRNVAAVTAWALMEEELGNEQDARSILERALGLFSAGFAEKKSLWRNYELMEQRLGNTAAYQQVYRRAMREAITLGDEADESSSTILSMAQDEKKRSSKDKHDANEECQLGRDFTSRSDEVEVVRWSGNGEGQEVWLNERFIESKLPFDLNKKRKKLP